MADALVQLPWLIRHARRTLAIIQQNIVFALGVKLLFIGLAVTGVATLWMAIAADMGASLLVIWQWPPAVAGACRLRRTGVTSQARGARSGGRRAWPPRYFPLATWAQDGLCFMYLCV